MKQSYLYASASFNTALIDLVKQCRRNLFDIKHARARMNQRLHLLPSMARNRGHGGSHA
jgi:hypothetical protein